MPEKMFVSVHMIVKENTYLGWHFLNSAFAPLLEAEYPNEIVLVDNGSSDFIHKLYKEWIPKFNKANINVKYHQSDCKNFRDLRNLCLKYTDPNTSYIDWVDSDSVLYPEDLDVLKNYIMPECYGKVGTLFTYFYHCMIHPFQVQATPDKINNYTMDDISCAKDNIFLYNKDLEWVKDKGVHEKLGNTYPNVTYQTKVQYVHLGYCRSQWRTFLKWLHYDMIQHGHVNYYKDENGVPIDEDGQNAGVTGKPKVREAQLPYLRDWREPNNILFDRRAISVPFPNEKAFHQHLPDSLNKMLDNLETKDEAGWIKFIDKLDGNKFYEKWVEKKNEVGSWKNSLDWAVEEAQKVDWGLV